MMTGRYLMRLVWFTFIVVNNYYCSVSAQVQVVIQPLNLTVFSGETAVFECNNINPPVDFSFKWMWFVNTNTLIATEGVHTSGRYDLTTSNGRTRSTLTILDTKIEDDNSQYNCQFGSVSQKATLTVMRTKKLDSTYPECKADLKTINADRNLTMKCSAAGGDPRPELQWYRNGIKLETRHDFYDGKSSYFDELTHALTVDDEGTIFICKAEGVAVDGSQTCQIHLNFPPTVVVTADKTAFNVGDSVTFTCLVISPWNITNYIWTVDNTLVTKSGYSYNLLDDRKTLILDNLQSTNDTGIEIGCSAVTVSGLNGTDYVVILLDDNKNTLMIIIIVIGTLAFLLVICTIFSLLIKRRQKKNFKASFNEQVISTERRTFREHAKDGIVQVMPLDNPTFINKDNPDYDNNIPGNHFSKINLNEHQIDENVIYDMDYNDVGHEMYVNAESVRSFGSFSSFDSFDQEHAEDDRCTYDNVGSHHSIGADMMYAQVLKANHLQLSASTTSVDGVADFGRLYAKPIKTKQKCDTRSIADVIDARQLYAKPKKDKQKLKSGGSGLTQHRPSIHHSLENILGTEDDALQNRSESVDDLYSKPNKKRLTAPSNQLALYAQPDKLKPTVQPRPLIYTTGRTIFPDDQPTLTSSNAIEHDFTYSSIA